MSALLSSLGLVVLAATTSPRATPPFKSAPQLSATGGTTLVLGSEQPLGVDGTIRLDDTLLVLGNRVISHRLTRDRVTVAAEIDLLGALRRPPTLTHDQRTSSCA